MISVTFSSNIPPNIRQEIIEKSNHAYTSTAGNWWCINDAAILTNTPEHEYVYIYNPITNKSMFVPKRTLRYVGYRISCTECGRSNIKHFKVLLKRGQDPIFWCMLNDCASSRKRTYECRTCGRESQYSRNLSMTTRYGEKLRFCSEECLRTSQYKRCANCNEVYGPEDIAKDAGHTLNYNWYCSFGCCNEAGYHRCNCKNKPWYKRDEAHYSVIDEKYMCNECLPKVGRTKSPTIPDHFIENMPSFGMELELSDTPFHKHGTRYNTAWLERNIPETWGIHADSSVTSQYEAVTEPFQAPQWEQISKIIDVINQHCHVNDSCGTHVHIGNHVNKTHQMNFAAMAIWLEPVWELFVKHTRWQGLNNFCRQSTNEWWGPRLPGNNGFWIESNNTLRGSDRYRKVNLESISEWRTIEIRALEGTLSTQVLSMWCSFWTHIWNITKNQWNRPRNCCTRHAFTDIGLSEEFITDWLEYISSRLDYEFVGKRKWCNKANWPVRIIRNEAYQMFSGWDEMEDKILQSQSPRIQLIHYNAKINDFLGRSGHYVADNYEIGMRTLGHLAMEGDI